VRRRERLVELRNALPFLVWIVSFSIALNSGWVLAYRILYLFSILIAFGLVWSGGAIWSLALTREPLGRILHAGDTFSERLVIANRSLLPQMWVAVEDSSNLPMHAMRQVLSYIGPRSRRQFLLRTRCLRRGRFTLGPVTLTGGDPFGIFRTRRQVGPTHKIVVYPRIFHLDSFGVVTGLLQTEARRLRRSLDPTTDASSVRDYYPGDEFRRIHWPSSIRQGRLIAKEFEHSPGGDIWVVLDMERSVQAGYLFDYSEAAEHSAIHEAWPLLDPSTEEYGVSVAASVAAYYLRSERAVGFLTYGSSRIVMQPDRGERQLARILDALAVVRAEGRLPLGQVLQREARGFKRFDTIVVITPSEDQEWVAAAHALTLSGVRPLPVVLERATFAGGAPSREVQRLLASRHLAFCPLANGQRPDEIACVTT